MPEGDTLHRTARTLHRALAGRVVTRFEAALAPLARADEAAPVAGRTVERVEAIGKHLLVRFSGGLVLRTHLRMNGAWHVYPAGARWSRPRASVRVAVHTAEVVAVGFSIPGSSRRCSSSRTSGSRTPARGASPRPAEVSPSSRTPS